MTLAEIISNTEALPPAPEVLPRLVEVMKDPDADANDIVAVIQTDPAIVAGALKLSNSGVYSPATPVTDLNAAVALLGIKEIYRIVNLVTGGEFLDEALSSMDIHRGGLWKHSLAVALMMDLIASDNCEHEGLPYTLGLLHDLGKLALHHGCGERYVDIFRKVETDRMAINAAESETLGFDHAEAGSKMLEDWGFPEKVYSPIRYQYRHSRGGRIQGACRSPSGRQLGCLCHGLQRRSRRMGARNGSRRLPHRGNGSRVGYHRGALPIGKIDQGFRSRAKLSIFSLRLEIRNHPS